MKVRKKEIFDAVQVTEEMVKSNTFPKGAVPSSSSTNSEGRITRFRGVIERRWTEEVEFFEIGDWLVTGENGTLSIFKEEWFVKTFEAIESS